MAALPWGPRPLHFLDWPPYGPPVCFVQCVYTYWQLLPGLIWSPLTPDWPTHWPPHLEFPRATTAVSCLRLSHLSVSPIPHFPSHQQLLTRLKTESFEQSYPSQQVMLLNKELMCQPGERSEQVLASSTNNKNNFHIDGHWWEMCQILYFLSYLYTMAALPKGLDLLDWPQFTSYPANLNLTILIWPPHLCSGPHYPLCRIS